MTEIQFSDNYSDVSDDTGFQFEFYCEGCRDAWRSEFKAYLPGKASRLLDAAGGIFGGVLGGAERAADYVKDAGYRAAHDKAFKEAIEEAKVHFFRCHRCGNYFCNKCFNPELNLCTSCAPSVEEEAEVAAREAEIEMARTRAQETVQSGKRRTDENVICPSCGARVLQAKFCSECGAPLAKKLTCPSCGATLTPGAKFCPECGKKL